MKRTLLVLALFALVAFAGNFATGGAELAKFKGYGMFRWTSFGSEVDPVDAAIGNEFGGKVWMAWVPKLNDYADLCISMTDVAAIEFDQVYLNMKLTDCISLTGGQIKLPFGYGYTRSGGSMLFADRTSTVSGSGSPTSDFGIYGGLDIGAQVTGNWAPVTVDIMFSNGTGARAQADTTINKQLTARLAVEPTEWLTVGGSVAMIGQPELIEDADTTESWSSNGIDVFAVANYPVSPTGTFNFVGEYMMLGTPSNDVDGFVLHDGARMSVMGGYDIKLDGNVVLAVQPAVRFDTIDPIAAWADDADEPEDNETIIDFCVGIDLFTNLNTLQLGMRNYSWENDDVDNGGTESYSDMYVNWRMNF